MNKTIKQLIKILIVIAPFILGSIGLAASGETVIDGMFYSFNMYFMCYGGEAPNILVEIARWVAPVVTFSGVAVALISANKRIRNWILFRMGKLTAIYGDREIAAVFAENLGSKVTFIDDETEKIPPANRYVLLENEDKNMIFFNAHKKDFGGRHVYMKCESLKSQETTADNFTLFCVEEIGARLFWNESDFHLQAKARAELSVAIIGFGVLGEEMVLNGLQNNIFKPGQRITYHVIETEEGGRESEIFHKKYHELDNIDDKIIFHEGGIFDNLELIKNADRVVICEQNNQIRLVQELIFTINEKIFDVMADDAGMFDVIEKKERIRVFDWKNKALVPENIFGDDLFKRAKAINLRYANLYSGVEETEENKQKEWDKLDSFTKYSNISSADYHDIRLQMIRQDGFEPDYDSLPEDYREKLSRLEHERWNRYHYINNWRQGDPENGKRKDAAKKIHKDLVRYDELTREEQIKDLENIKVMLGIR